MLITLLSLLVAAETSSATGPIVFIGTYTKPPSEGIYAFRLDTKSGHLQPLGLAAKVANPSFVAIHPNGKFLYTVTEARAGAVTAFAIDRESGKLTELNQASTKGDGPCHLSVDRAGHFLVAVNYGSGSVTRVPIGADGRLGEPSAFDQHGKPAGGPGTDPKRQEGPHAHSVNFSPDDKFAIVADLGRDEVITYKVDSGGLDPAQVAHLAPGSGPRHFAFHPSGKTAYVINELKSTVTVFDYSAPDGVLKEKQTISTLPAGFTGESSTAEVLVHPSGKFLYGSNRGHNSIAIFAIEDDGKLRFIGTEPTRGDFPRNFGIDPTGQWLIAANQNSSTIVMFKIDRKTGKLTPVGDPIAVGSPVCVRFLQ
jgi:6-phosphogluconolactonase